MTENDEKLAEEKAFEFDNSLIENKAYPFDEQLAYGYKHGFLAGIAHERKRIEQLKRFADEMAEKLTTYSYENGQTNIVMSGLAFEYRDWLKNNYQDSRCICSPGQPADHCPKHPVSFEESL